MLKITSLIALFFLCLSAQAQKSSLITEHGYRFLHHTQKGGPKPQRGETIVAQVKVWVGDSLMSDSRSTATGSYRFDLPAADVTLDHYPPIFDAALLMGRGDSATIFQPIDTFMRKFIPPAVRAEKEVRFEILLVGIVSAEAKAKSAELGKAFAKNVEQKVQAKAQNYRTGLLDAQITTRPSGLKFLIEEKGRGAAIKTGDAVQVHYFGLLRDGTPFDNSFQRREPISFNAGVGQMIPGFDEGVLQLNHGGKAYLFIPPALGYGDQDAAGGTIPANSELVFYIEVL